MNWCWSVIQGLTYQRVAAEELSLPLMEIFGRAAISSRAPQRLMAEPDSWTRRGFLGHGGGCLEGAAVHRGWSRPAPKSEGFFFFLVLNREEALCIKTCLSFSFFPPPLLCIPANYFCHLFSTKKIKNCLLQVAYSDTPTITLITETRQVLVATLKTT